MNSKILLIALTIAAANSHAEIYKCLGHPILEPDAVYYQSSFGSVHPGSTD